MTQLPTNQVITLDDNGNPVIAYEAQPHQLAFHLSTTPNLLALGTRGTGKSVQLRWDAHLRCLMIPGFHALILRRTMPELRKSHLKSIEKDMKLLGGVYLQTTFLAKYPNGSTLLFAHCETEADILNFLSSEYGFIGFDELSTFTLQQFLQISAAARAPEGAGYNAVVRCSSNPMGIGAEWMEQWFINKDVNYEEYPDYNPEDFEMQFSTLRENKYIDAESYEKRLKNLPDHVRRAWLKGEFVFEGMYFSDFRKTDDEGNPWHVIDSVPLFQDEPVYRHPWLSIYRAIDWGYHPDPAVCLWIAVLPNKRAIVFKEMKWKKTLAADVAREIVKESAGMRIVESFCLPLDAPVWMGDFSFKPLSDVKVGDEVISGPPVGQKFPRVKGVRKTRKYTAKWRKADKGKSCRYLQRATVTAIHRTRQEVLQLTFASGRTAYCTPDHKWLDANRSHEHFITPYVGAKLAHIVDDPGPVSDPLIAAWVAGMYDGEGCRELIAQSLTHNPDLYEAIYDRLAHLGFEPSMCESGVRWKGGTQAALKFVNQVPSIRYRKNWADYFLLRSHYRTPDTIIAIESRGIQDVGCITTSTGNFIAYGYLSSNCDPTMNIKEGQAYSIGEIFETNGVPVTAATNDRAIYGYAVNEYLNTLIDQKPQVQFVKGMGNYGCKDFIRTITTLRMDKNDPHKIADGEDHWVVAFAYFAMGAAPPSRNPSQATTKRWLMPKRGHRNLAC